MAEYSSLRVLNIAWAGTNRALALPPGGVHITPSGSGPFTGEFQFTTSIVHIYKYKINPTHNNTKNAKIQEFHSNVHTHIKGYCSHIHPQVSLKSNYVKGYPSKISLKNSNIHKINKTCKIQCCQCPLSLLVSP